MPAGVAANGAGNEVIADADNDRIRVAAATTGTFSGQAMTAREIDTLARNGTAGFSGDGGTASSAELSAPIGVAVNSAGTVLIVDEDNHLVRVVTG
jgi:DNA-binding beta-propeller fold protein YncE